MRPEVTVSRFMTRLAAVPAITVLVLYRLDAAAFPSPLPGEDLCYDNYGGVPQNDSQHSMGYSHLIYFDDPSAACVFAGES